MTDLDSRNSCGRGGAGESRRVVAMEQSANATDQEHDLVLPGFRFHPTDEELVGFYLRRKVVGRPIGLDIIKQIDIYKYDPWDLPKITVGVEKEWFFFCHRARKYRNSVRPNRVTGSGFWKATGIDKQVLSTGAGRDTCIGLKKSLVYYRGSAGKGVKTDWMMHEFRLPPVNEATGTYDDAEVWTICRIFERNISGRKSAQHLRYGISMERTSVDTRELIMNHDGRAMPTCTSREDDEHGSCIKQTAEVANPSGWEDDDHGCMKQAKPSGWEVIRPSLASSSGSCSSTSVTDDIIAAADYDVNWDDLGGLMDIMFEPIPSDEHFYLQTSTIVPEELLVNEEAK